MRRCFLEREWPADIRRFLWPWDIRPRIRGRPCVSHHGELTKCEHAGEPHTLLQPETLTPRRPTTRASRSNTCRPWIYSSRTGPDMLGLMAGVSARGGLNLHQLQEAQRGAPRRKPPIERRFRCAEAKYARGVIRLFCRPVSSARTGAIASPEHTMSLAVPPPDAEQTIPSRIPRVAFISGIAAVSPPPRRSGITDQEDNSSHSRQASPLRSSLLCAGMRNNAVKLVCSS